MEFYVTALPIGVAVVGAILVLATLGQIPITHSRSLSQHIMQSRRTIVQGMVLLSLACMLLWVWVALLDVSWALKLALAMTGASYLATGLVPYGVSRWRDSLHDIGAWTGLAAMLAANILLAYNFAGIVAIVAGVAAVVQLGMIALFVVTKPGQRQFMLLGQITYLAVFLAAIVTTGFMYA